MGAIDLLTATARKAGLDVVRRNYYSPVPGDLDDQHFTEPSPLNGIDWDTDAQFAWLEETVQPGYVPLSARMFSPGDQAVLDAVVRRYRPQLVMELGSGESTQVIAHAHPGRLRVYDPFPNDRVGGAIDVRRVSATDIPLQDFQDLQAGDLLFIDTSHTVKAGSEVNRLVLDVLPTLRPGVIVHFHDIFLPWEYPQEWLTTKRLYWNEQYLVQAFLTGNPEWRVLVGLYGLCRADLARYEGVTGCLEGCSLYITKTG